MTLIEYRRYYIGFIVTTLGPAIDRAARCLPDSDRDFQQEADLHNQLRGLTILILVSFVESNFLSKTELRQLRQFSKSGCNISTRVTPVELSGFIYIRDCFAHDPSGAIFSSGKNALAFSQAINDGTFRWATISNNSLMVSPSAVHQLHLMILRFFGEDV